MVPTISVSSTADILGSKAPCAVMAGLQPVIFRIPTTTQHEFGYPDTARLTVYIILKPGPC